MRAHWIIKTPDKEYKSIDEEFTDGGLEKEAERLFYGMSSESISRFILDNGDYLILPYNVIQQTTFLLEVENKKDEIDDDEMDEHYNQGWNDAIKRVMSLMGVCFCSFVFIEKEGSVSQFYRKVVRDIEGLLNKKD